MWTSLSYRLLRVVETESNGFVSGGDVSYVPTREPETKATRQTCFGYCTSKLMSRFELSLSPLPCIT